MSATEHNERLNALLIRLGWSLLQYIGQSWPWIGLDRGAELKALNELVARQQSHAARLHDLLWERPWRIEQGVFPDHSDMHYLSLDFVLRHLVQDQGALLAEIEQTLEACRDDRQAVTLLGGILAGEREILERLKDMANAAPARAA